MRVFLARLLLWVCLVMAFTTVGVARLNYPKEGAWESIQRTLVDAWSWLLWGIR